MEYSTSSPFDVIRQTDEQGNEFWSARDLYKMLGYSRWEKFTEVVERAMNLCALAQQNIATHFDSGYKIAQLGSGSQRHIEDYHLTRYALYLTLASCDLKNPESMRYFLHLTSGLINNPLVSSIRLPDIIAITKEQVTVTQIIRAFKNDRFVQHFSVSPYFIDLYFYDHKIAVECDEDNHRYYCPEKEAKRQKYIEKTLHCTFVRYNPDDRNFNIGDVIHEIMGLIYKR